MFNLLFLNVGSCPTNEMNQNPYFALVNAKNYNEHYFERRAHNHHGKTIVKTYLWNCLQVWFLLSIYISIRRAPTKSGVDFFTCGNFGSLGWFTSLSDNVTQGYTCWDHREHDIFYTRLNMHLIDEKWYAWDQTMRIYLFQTTFNQVLDNKILPLWQIYSKGPWSFSTFSQSSCHLLILNLHCPCLPTISYKNLEI